MRGWLHARLVGVTQRLWLWDVSGAVSPRVAAWGLRPLLGVLARLATWVEPQEEEP